MKDKFNLDATMKRLGDKIKAGWSSFKTKATPKFVTEAKVKREEEIKAVDLAALTKPINDAATSGPKKMKDFSAWAGWKTFCVGLIGVIAVIGIWWAYAAITTSLGGTSWLSSPPEVWDRFIATASNGILWEHLWASLQRILVGYAIALVVSIPVGFIMAWYKPFRAFLDPFIQFLRCIPPLAYVPIIVVALGTGESSKYFIIWLACFLTMTVTIYQGIRNVDMTLIKASYTFGARDKNLFIDVVVPSSFPFILTAMRLGVGVALTTLIAAELTGGRFGLGAFVNSMGNVTRFAEAFMGIIILGAIGIIFDKLLLLLERRLTRWK